VKKKTKSKNPKQNSPPIKNLESKRIHALEAIEKCKVKKLISTI